MLQDRIAAAEKELQKLRATSRPLLIYSGIPDFPFGVWGTCALVGYRGVPFVLTAAHLVPRTHSSDVVIQPANESRTPLRLAHGFVVQPHGDENPLDIVAYRTTLAGVDLEGLRDGQFAVLDYLHPHSWERDAHTSGFAIIGFPQDLCEATPESRRTGQVLLVGRYVGPARPDGYMHTLRVDNPLDLGNFGGLSGSPVYSLQELIGCGSILRFAGIAVAGTAASGLVHFISSAAACFVMEQALHHFQRFGADGPNVQEEVTRLII